MTKKKPTGTIIRRDIYIPLGEFTFTDGNDKHTSFDIELLDSQEFVNYLTNIFIQFRVDLAEVQFIPKILFPWSTLKYGYFTLYQLGAEDTWSGTLEQWLDQKLGDLPVNQRVVHGVMKPFKVPLAILETRKQWQDHVSDDQEHIARVQASVFSHSFVNGDFLGYIVAHLKVSFR